MVEDVRLKCSAWQWNLKVEVERIDSNLWNNRLVMYPWER